MPILHVFKNSYGNLSMQMLALQGLCRPLFQMGPISEDGIPEKVNQILIFII